MVDVKYINKKLERAANLYYDGLIQDAALIFNELIHEYPDVELVYCNMATIFHDYKRYDEAIEIYKQAIERGLFNSLIFKSLGVCYEKLKNYHSAIENLKMAISLDDQNGEAYYIRARCYLRIGDLDKANYDSRKAAALGCFR